MSAPPAPPSDTPAAPEPLVVPSGFVAILGGMAILPILFLIVFHVGAGYLSYQKFGSFGWAFLDFLFAYFYYPYYAFFLTGPSSQPAPVNAMMGGLRKLFKKR
jgi:hypothetical protein